MKKIIMLFPILIMVFLSGCTHVDRGNFGPFKRSLNNTSYGYEVIGDFTKKAPTKYIEKFEVRPGDCSSNDTWSDCTHDRERSELSGPKDTFNGSEYWYGWSLYIPNEYKNISPTKVALGQFHQHNRAKPAWMFQNGYGGYFLDSQKTTNSENYYVLIDKEDLKGKWHKIELNVKWSKNDNGFFKVWVNGKQKVDYIGRTMTASTIYFKYGLYRSFMSRYKNAYNKKEVPAQTVYYSNVKRAKSREGLLP